jgi:large subunit ribosomal protein L22
LTAPETKKEKQETRNKMQAVAKLKNYPTSPRKMRLLADLIRGHRVERALAILEHNPKHPAVPLRKLVLSAINNWKQKNESGDESELVVKTIYVDGARTLKRMRPAPQGRGYRVRKRSNHVTIVVDYPTFDQEELVEEVEQEEEQKEVEAIAEQLEELAEETEAEETKSKKPAKKSAAKKTATKRTVETKKSTKKKKK